MHTMHDDESCCPVAGLLRDAFRQSDNPRQAPCGLAALLAETWFDSSPVMLSAGGTGLRSEAVTDLQNVVEEMLSRMQRRAAFLEIFLDP